MFRSSAPSPAPPLIAELFELHASDAVARAQVDALRQRIPYLYAILTFNLVAVSATHVQTAPGWLAVLLPAAAVSVLVTRMVWWARLRPGALPDAQIRKRLKSTVILGCLIGAAIVGWAMYLRRLDMLVSSSGSAEVDGQVDFFVGITVVSCIFLLMHLRLAAILLALIVVVPFSAYLLSSLRLVESAIAINLLLVSGAMLYVAVSFGGDFVRMVTNATDLQRLSAQNARLAASDAMTGLPNRRHFFQELEDVANGRLAFAVIVVDLDGFKQINDIYGHNAGDEVLCAVADRLQGLAPPGACVARLGGDEFACLMVGASAGAAALTADRLVAACGMPIVCASFVANIGASAGICLSQSVLDDPIAAYERADYALCEAKRAGRGRVESFGGGHNLSMRRSSHISQSLRTPDLSSELSAVYQPIFIAGTLRISSFEALLRWTSREMGPVGPAEFVPIAERTDLIFELSRFILRTALQEAASWPEHVCVKVNLSVRDLMSMTQTEALMGVLRHSGVRPARVTLEVTESTFADSLAVVRSNVELLRSAGCEIAIDDFGVGYSNLNYIHALSPNIIKIDRLFVDTVTDQAASQRIIRTIIELARNLGAKSVAEGVETAAQARLLAELGCDELQGYFLSRPVPADVARGMVAQACAA